MTRQQELKYKRILKRAFKQRPAKPLKSISDDWRRMYKSTDDESYYEVALFEADGLTDEEIEENTLRLVNGLQSACHGTGIPAV